MAEQVNQTVGVIVSFISAALAVITGKKISDEKGANKWQKRCNSFVLMH